MGQTVGQKGAYLSPYIFFQENQMIADRKYVEEVSYFGDFKRHDRNSFRDAAHNGSHGLSQSSAALIRYTCQKESLENKKKDKD